MLDAFSRAVVTADSKGTPIGTTELASLRKYVSDANKRIDAYLQLLKMFHVLLQMLFLEWFVKIQD